MKFIRLIEVIQRVVDSKWVEQSELLKDAESKQPSSKIEFSDIANVADVIEKITISVLFNSKALFVEDYDSPKLVRYDLAQFVQTPSFRFYEKKWGDLELDSLESIFLLNFHMAPIQVKSATFESTNSLGKTLVLPNFSMLPLFFDRNFYSISFVGYNLAEKAEYLVQTIFEHGVRTQNLEVPPEAYWFTKLITPTAKVAKLWLEPYENRELCVSSDFFESGEFYKYFEIARNETQEMNQQALIKELLLKFYPDFKPIGDKEAWSEGQSWNEIISQIEPDFRIKFRKPPSKSAIQRAAGYSK